MSVDQAIFQPFPSEVIFQQFEPNLVYSFPLQLRNLDRVARHIKVTSEVSPYFSLSCQKLPGAKIAPGMEITYSIIFTPEEKKVGAFIGRRSMLSIDLLLLLFVL